MKCDCTFEVGDVVRTSRIGGPLMQVTAIDGDAVKCLYWAFNRDGHTVTCQYEVFDRSLLESVDDPHAARGQR